MPRSKLIKFRKIKEFENVIEIDSLVKGAGPVDFFDNDNDIILELGCGNGEYTNALAKMYPDKNFIGVDI